MDQLETLPMECADPTPPSATTPPAASPKVDLPPCLMEAEASLQEAATAGPGGDMRRQQLAMRAEEKAAKEARDAEKKANKKKDPKKPKAKGRPRKAVEELAPLESDTKKRKIRKVKSTAQAAGGEEPEVPKAAAKTKAAAKSKAKAAARRKSKSKRALETLSAAKETTKKRRILKYEQFTFDKAVVNEVIQVLEKFKDTVYDKKEEVMHATSLGN